MKFAIEKRITGAHGRAGRLETPHGTIETPAFVVVGTKATVKALTVTQLKEAGVQVVLGNTYHLHLEPGEKLVKEAGGLAKFMGFDGPTMTDSGGFQVFSLGAGFDQKNRSKISTQKRHPHELEIMMSSGRPLTRIDEDGVTFKSHKDGSEHRFTPERSVEIQHDLGADIIFAFDECTSPVAPFAYQKEATLRTHRWAARCLRKHRELKVESLKLKGEAGNRSQVLFGIVQGGRFEELRKESARVIGKMEFDGFGIGGSFDKSDMGTAVRFVNDILPLEKPRHLLGIGEPEDLFEAIRNGCDLFDCVTPTRNGRTGSLYTRKGKINIANSGFRNDFSPVEEGCDCYTCSHFTKAYLCHLFRAEEMLAATLATIHNLRFFTGLMEGIRSAISNGSFGEFRDRFLQTTPAG